MRKLYDSSALSSGKFSDSTTTKVGTASAPNFIYDNKGNLVCDASKNMIVEYDWRNMPVKFYLYSSISSILKNWSDVRAFSSANLSLVTSTVVMTYDASGNRVKKEVFDGLATEEGISAAPTSGIGQDLVIANASQLDTLKVQSDGTLYHNEPITTESVTAMGQNIPHGALIVQDQNGSQMPISSSALAIPAPLATNTSGSTIVPGDFDVAFAGTNGLPSPVPQMCIEQAGDRREP